MKLLTETTDQAELNRLRLLYESKGIIVHIGNENTAGNYLSFHPSGKYALFVVYEEQYKDAKILLENENHIVDNPLDIAVYKKNLDESAGLHMGKMLNVLSIVLGLVVVIGVVLYFQV